MGITSHNGVVEVTHGPNSLFSDPITATKVPLEKHIDKQDGPHRQKKTIFINEKFTP